MKCSLGCSYCTITEKLQKYTDLKEELIRYMATEHGLYNTKNYYTQQVLFQTNYTEGENCLISVLL